MATSNFCGGAGRAEKGLDIVLRWCLVCRGCCAGAVDGLCCEESFRGSRVKGVPMACQWVAPMASAPDA